MHRRLDAVDFIYYPTKKKEGRDVGVECFRSPVSKPTLERSGVKVFINREIIAKNMGPPCVHYDWVGETKCEPTGKAAIAAIGGYS